MGLDIWSVGPITILVVRYPENHTEDGWDIDSLQRSSVCLEVERGQEVSVTAVVETTKLPDILRRLGDVGATVQEQSEPSSGFEFLSEDSVSRLTPNKHGWAVEQLTE